MIVVDDVNQQQRVSSDNAAFPTRRWAGSAGGKAGWFRLIQ
jgi:hypothetical protein